VCTRLYDQLGQQGEVGVSRMLRESITVGHYAMINSTTGAPFPDFFSTLLWREVVGSRVLGPMEGSKRINNQGQDLRVYARCARMSAAEVVVVVVNLSPTATSSVTVNGGTKSGSQKEWLLTAGTGTEVWSWGRSQQIALNGKVLRLNSAGEAPEMAPKESAAGAAVSIAPLSVALVQYEPAAGAKACS
jgi:heparanase 1